MPVEERLSIEKAINANLEKYRGYLQMFGDCISNLEGETLNVQRGITDVSQLLVLALIHRLYDLGITAESCLDKNMLVPASLLAQAAAETVAVLFTAVKEIETTLQTGDVKKLTDRLNPMAFGGRRDDMSYQVTNILTYIDKVKREVPGFREAYDLLSEYAHPNMFGVIGSYYKFDERHKSAIIGREHGFSSASAAYACPLVLRVCLARAVTETHKFFELLPALKMLTSP